MKTSKRTSNPAWGPYTKLYVGISHVPDFSLGCRVDVSLFPGLYRRSVNIPYVKQDSGFMPVESASDFSFYTLRHEMPPGRDIHCDISYVRLEENAVLCRAEFVNASDAPENVVLQGMISMHPPPQEPAVVSLPEDGVWIDAIQDLVEIHAPREDEPKQSLVWSGRIRGQVETDNLVGGRGLDSTVLCRPGDRVTWRTQLNAPISGGSLFLRYRKQNAGPTLLRLRVGKQEARLTLEPTGEAFAWANVMLEDLPAGPLDLVADAEDEADFLSDGFALVPDGQEPQATLQTWSREPTRLTAPHASSLMLTYGNLDNGYGMAWGKDASQVREYCCDRIENLLYGSVNNQVKERFEEPGSTGHYTNLYLRPLEVPAGERTVRYLLICTGTESELRTRLTGFDPEDPRWENVFHAARETRFEVKNLASGEALRLGQERMAATLLGNMVYPMGCREEWIAHWTPGRWWDSLYTWDAGFHAIGLANIESAHALRHIQTYLIDEDAPDSNAFVHWGTPIPTQFHALNCLAQRAPSQVDWTALRPSLKRANAFLVGEAPGATTNPFQSGLLATWDYFYNSGGWDDYPPQVAVHAGKLTARVAPVSNTAHSLRFAKWLQWIQADSGQQTIIERLTRALQEVAWDEETGVFSYVVHDEAGDPTDFLRDENGVNLNLGMDGMLPLTAGICSEDQVERMVERMFDPEGMWTPIGITSVDQRAPYYRHDGYWNGAVWFPHQWMIWKSLLDHGYGDEAWKLASTALQVWQTEVERSGRCFEHFIVQGGRGAGWHQFGGLSAPILDWFAAYHRPGCLTGGLDVMEKSLETGKDWKADLEVLPSTFTRGALLLATVGEGGDPVVTWNGEELPAQRRQPGTLEIRLPAGPQDQVHCGQLCIRG